MGGRSTIDWEGVERDYRIGQLTVRQTAKKHGCAVSGLMLRAKKERWSRDLSEVVALATKARLRSAVAAHWTENGANLERATHSEVENAASVNVAIILGQQQRVKRLNNLLEKMVAEVEEITQNAQSLDSIVAALKEVDPASAEAIAQLRTLRNRVTTLKDAAAVAAALNQEERKIFRLEEDNARTDTSVESLLAAMKADPLSLGVNP